MEFATDASFPTQPESGMNEEQRYVPTFSSIENPSRSKELKSLEEIESKVAIHRKWLESKYGLTSSNEDVTGNKRISSERRDRHDDNHESSRKRHRSESRSKSPQRKLSLRDMVRGHDSDKDRERHRERDRGHNLESERRDQDRREKSGSKERDDHDRGRGRDRDRRRRVK
ncbi:RNA PROCESSING PROTEIN [Salix viminalis]|uniref:RNA PROCESSING PROTEIN n=1 Tax=Salix viminalis TaxID=40686 RepID=A0A9Q0ZRA6_SALVM|nr:RNA PROCESSING PROTEIN [Salix viminalis]